MTHCHLDRSDIDAMCNMLAKQSLDVAANTGLEAARRKLQNTCVDVLRGCRGAFGAGAPGGPPMPGSYGGAGVGPPGAAHQGSHAQAAAQPPPIPECLQLLPLYTMALQKAIVFRGGTDVRADERAAMFQRCVHQ